MTLENERGRLSGEKVEDFVLRSLSKPHTVFTLVDETRLPRMVIYNCLNHLFRRSKKILRSNAVKVTLSYKGGTKVWKTPAYIAASAGVKETEINGQKVRFFRYGEFERKHFVREISSRDVTGCLKDLKAATTREIADKLNTDQAKIRAHLRRLLRKGKVHQIGELKPDGTYQRLKDYGWVWGLKETPLKTLYARVEKLLKTPLYSQYIDAMKERVDHSSSLNMPLKATELYIRKDWSKTTLHYFIDRVMQIYPTVTSEKIGISQYLWNSEKITSEEDLKENLKKIRGKSGILAGKRKLTGLLSEVIAATTFNETTKKQAWAIRNFKVFQNTYLPKTGDTMRGTEIDVVVCFEQLPNPTPDYPWRRWFIIDCKHRRNPLNRKDAYSFYNKLRHHTIPKQLEPGLFLVCGQKVLLPEFYGFDRRGKPVWKMEHRYVIRQNITPIVVSANFTKSAMELLRDLRIRFFYVEDCVKWLRIIGTLKARTNFPQIHKRFSKEYDEEPEKFLATSFRKSKDALYQWLEENFLIPS